MKLIDECIVEDQVKDKFFQRENGKTFSLKSENEFRCKVVAIDECCFKGIEMRRCDFLFLVNHKNQPEGIAFKESKAFYVELKGEDIESACEQLYNAIDRTKTQITNHVIIAKVVGTKGSQPEMKNGEYFRRVKKLIRREIDFHKVGKFNAFNHIETI